jgi:prevent-host-death family protein
MTTSHGHHSLTDMNINAAEFKAKCLKIIDEVAITHQPLVITKRGKPVARIVPIETEAQPSGLFGHMKGTGEIVDDIINVPSGYWAAETGAEDDLYAPVAPKKRKMR